MALMSAKRCDSVGVMSESHVNVVLEKIGKAYPGAISVIDGAARIARTASGTRRVNTDGRCRFGQLPEPEILPPS